jgi:hypothetical protein
MACRPEKRRRGAGCSAAANAPGCPPGVDAPPLAPGNQGLWQWDAERGRREPIARRRARGEAERRPDQRRAASLVPSAAERLQHMAEVPAAVPRVVDAPRPQTRPMTSPGAAAWPAVARRAALPSRTACVRQDRKGDRDETVGRSATMHYRGDAGLAPTAPWPRQAREHDTTAALSRRAHPPSAGRSTSSPERSDQQQQCCAHGQRPNRHEHRLR